MMTSRRPTEYTGVLQDVETQGKAMSLLHTTLLQGFFLLFILSEVP
jgi:hypothetical protein